MAQIKINGVTYDATISGMTHDTGWDGRYSKTITLEMTHDTALGVFCDDAEWSILTEQTDENGNPVEIDNSEFCIAGDVTDHRDGTVSVKMGKLTELEEAYEILFGGEE